mgnify:CR=1 FL=1
MRPVDELNRRYPLLASLDGPGGMRDMSDDELETLCAEVRAAIIDTCLLYTSDAADD